MWKLGGGLHPHFLIESLTETQPQCWILRFSPTLCCFIFILQRWKLSWPCTPMSCTITDIFHTECSGLRSIPLFPQFSTHNHPHLYSQAGVRSCQPWVHHWFALSRRSLGGHKVHSFSLITTQEQESSLDPISIEKLINFYCLKRLFYLSFSGQFRSLGHLKWEGITEQWTLHKIKLWGLTRMLRRVLNLMVSYRCKLKIIPSSGGNMLENLYCMSAPKFLEASTQQWT